MLLAIIYLLYEVNRLKTIEGFDNAEAVASLAAMYQDGNLTVSNITATGTINSTGDIATNGSITAGGNLQAKGGNTVLGDTNNKWILHANQSGDSTNMHVTRDNGSGWDWGNQQTISSNGTLTNKNVACANLTATTIKVNNGANKGTTWFNYQNGGTNYIRGSETNVDNGPVKCKYLETEFIRPKHGEVDWWTHKEVSARFDQAGATYGDIVPMKWHHGGEDDHHRTMGGFISLNHKRHDNWRYIAGTDLRNDGHEQDRNSNNQHRRK